MYIMSDLIREKFFELTTQWMSLPDEDFKKMVVNCVVPIKIMEEYYRYCLSDGLTKIEDLADEKKRELYSKARQWKPDGDKEYLVMICRIIWLQKHSEHLKKRSCENSVIAKDHTCGNMNLILVSIAEINADG